MVVSADTLTEGQIRELMDHLRVDGKWTSKNGRLYWSRQDDIRACYAALGGEVVASKWTRETALARCAELWNARAKEVR